MKKAWEWLKRWGAALFGGLLVLVGAGWLWNRKAKELGRVRDELAVASAKKEIARLQGRREEIARQSDAKAEDIMGVDREIAANKRKLVEAHENGHGLSEEEVERAFARLGY